MIILRRLVLTRFTKRKSSLPKNLPYKSLEGRRRAATGYLKRIIESVVSQSSSNIIDKTSLYRFTGIPPLDLVEFKWTTASITESGQPTPVFVRDPEHSFDKVMSFGHDFKVVQY